MSKAQRATLFVDEDTTPSRKATPLTTVHTIEPDTDWTPVELQVHPRMVEVSGGQFAGTERFLETDSVGVKVSLCEWVQGNNDLVHFHALVPGVTFPSEDGSQMCSSGPCEVSGAVKVMTLAMLCAAICRALSEAGAAGWLDVSADAEAA
jgi:hypothetical protein